MPLFNALSMLFAIFVVVLTVLIHFGWFSIPLALKVGAILLILAWVYALVRVPWDLYFRARRGRIDGETSLRRGIVLDDSVLGDLGGYEQRLLYGAVLSHLISALVAGLLSALAPDVIHVGFVWLFLLSMVIRPTWELYQHLAHRIADLTAKTRYPREDVLQLRGRVDQLESGFRSLEQHFKEFTTEVRDQISRQDRRQSAAEERESKNHLAVQKRVHELSRELENVVTKVTADKELIAGVRAFARMFREQA